MIYILENDKLKVKISSMGAELQSVRRLEDDTEYLWQGDTTDWQQRAPHLFPICSLLREGESNDATKPGFAQNTEWVVLHQKATAVAFQMLDTPETMAVYPFRFSMELSYTLTNEDLSVALIVHNLGEQTMPFAVGTRPGFTLPSAVKHRFEGYSIEFDEPCEPRRLSLPAACGCSPDSEPFPLEDGRQLRLRHDLFDGSPLFLRDMSRGVTLRVADNPRSVHLSYPHMPYLGLWHRPHTETAYVALQPCTAVGDGAEMIQLEPQGVYRNVYTLSFR